MTPEQLAKSGTEHAEQMALFQCCALAANNVSPYCDNFLPSTRLLLPLLFAINNAVGRNSAIHGARNKAEGVKAGVPDIFLPVARQLCLEFGKYQIQHGLFIEMKRADGKPSDVDAKQKKWHNNLRAQGYRVEVCFGWQQARDVLIDYLR